MILGIITGAITGILLGPHAEPLGDLGLLFIRLLKAMATPLLFFGVVDTFCRTEITAKDGARLFGMSGANALAALIISFGLTRLLPLENWIHFDQIRALVPPLASATAQTATSLSFAKVIDGFIPSSAVQPFLENSVIPIVILAIFLGTAIRARKKSEADLFPIDQFMAEMFQVIGKILGSLVHLVPVAVFCVIAKATGTGGFAWVQTLSVFVAVVMAGMMTQVFFYYAIVLKIAGFKPLQFFKQASEALLTAMSTGSSLATLPVTLSVLQDKMKVPPRFARLAAAVGTNLNHDGILLYEAIAAIFVARLYGIPLSFVQQLKTAMISIFASIGIAGVPEAGLITLTLVLGAAGLPLESVALFLPFDWFIGRLRATTNVASDLMVANILNGSQNLNSAI